MDIIETIRTRKSCRAFRDEPLSRETVERVLQDAAMAPSAINMQPWEVHVVMGAERKRLSRRLLRAYRERRLTCGPGSAKPIPERFMERARQCAEAMEPLAARMGTDFKTYVNEGSLDFYGAHCAVLIFLDECFPPDRAVDVGVLVGYLVLAAAGHGLASCPIGLVTQYGDDILDQLNIPETKRLVMSVALGFPDESAAMNEFRSPRIPVNEFVRWID